jgi:hypothetical protein
MAAALCKAAFRALTLVRLMALNLIREIGGTAMWRRLRAHLRLGLRWRSWPSRIGTRATMTAAMLPLMPTLARTAATAMTMFLSRLCESGGGGQGQDSDRYQQTAHLILRENTARLITSLYRFGFHLAPLWSRHA